MMEGALATRNRSFSRQALELTHPNAAGIDIGSASHFVAVPPDRDDEPVREFASFTTDLHRLADWLRDCGVDTVAMESTGVYWIPLFELLDARAASRCCWSMPGMSRTSRAARATCWTASGCSS
jgi:transposase